MPNPRARTLLDFAIAASAAVVPVLVVVLLAVAPAQRPDPAALSAGTADRHVSVRELAALKTFEHAIVRRSDISVGPPSAELILDRVPTCRAAWDGRENLLARLRRALGRGGASVTAPAQRLASQLATLDQELSRFSTGGERRVNEAVGFDSARWFDAVGMALRVPIEAPEYPGHPFTVQCADIAHAVATLSRGDGRVLGVLSWRGSEGTGTITRWRPDQFVEVTARQLARANPWQGLLGCVFMGRSALTASPPGYALTAAGAPDEGLCTRREVFMTAAGDSEAAPKLIAGEPTAELSVDDERWKVPPSLDALLRPLAPLRRPSGALYRLYTEAGLEGDAPTAYRYGPNRIDVDGAPVDVGFSVDLTIDPSLQALAQKTVACYTGRQEVCNALGMVRAEDTGRALGQRMLERALVRMAAVAVVDVQSGRIEALAGALSPCARHEVDGPVRAAGCDKRLPYPPHYRPDALLNPAVFHDAMPGSVIKPIMAAAFLTDPDVGARWLAAERAAMRLPGPPTPDSLRGQLAHSNSARFLDRMFCADQDFLHCQRPWRVQAMAAAFGWNGGCSTPRDDCGKEDLLFGRAVDAGADAGRVAPLGTLIPYGRLMVEPMGGKLEAPFYLRPATALDTNKVRACAAGADRQRLTRDDWEKCSGGAVVDVVAEGWGQGHARASALGVAGMMAALAAAANGQAELRQPQLVSALRGVRSENGSRLESAASRFGLNEAKPIRLSQDAAQVILSALSYSHRVGTARLACEQVFDARTCQGMDWIAGKTGTPSFPNDGRSLNELWRLCGRGAARTRSEQAACGPLRPYKWYVAAYRTDPGDARWTKAIAVLTERNWLKDTGRIDGAGDQGPNPAAEIAMQIAGRDAGFLAGSPP